MTSNIEQVEKTQLEKSRDILAKLDTYSCLNENKREFIKEDIGSCSKCNKLIALKFTVCGFCNQNFCKQHREAHICNNTHNSDKAKFLEGKNSFIKRLKLNRIKAGVV